MSKWDDLPLLCVDLMDPWKALNFSISVAEGQGKPELEAQRSRTGGWISPRGGVAERVRDSEVPPARGAGCP